MPLLIENSTVLTAGKTPAVYPNIPSSSRTAASPRSPQRTSSSVLPSGASMPRSRWWLPASSTPTPILQHVRSGPHKNQTGREFVDVLKNLWWRLDSALTTEDCDYSALIALFDAIRHGTTTLIDHHASPQAVRGSLAAIEKAVKQSGLRACLCYELSDRDGSRIAKEGLEENVAFIRHCQRSSLPEVGRADPSAPREGTPIRMIRTSSHGRGAQRSAQPTAGISPLSTLNYQPATNRCRPRPSMRRSRSRTPRWKRPRPWARSSEKRMYFLNKG